VGFHQNPIFRGAFDWDDLRHLLNRATVVNRGRVTADCVRGFGFLADLTGKEEILAGDKYQREQALAEGLRAGLWRDSRLPAANLRPGWIDDVG